MRYKETLRNLNAQSQNLFLDREEDNKGDMSFRFNFSELMNSQKKE